MALCQLSLIRRLFGSSEPSEQEKAELYREAMLMTLARGTSSDHYTDAAEVETVVNIVSKHVGESVSEADVRVAARSDLYETAPLEKCLGRCSRLLDETQRKNIVRALIEVIRADGHIRSGEADFFNMVVGALGLTAIDILDLASAA